MLIGTSPGFTQTHHHDGQSLEVDKFYSTWYQPDNPSQSCCNQTDCYPTEAYFRSGFWYARQRETGDYIQIPPLKIEQNRDNPDGRSHVCANPHGVVFCFIPGGGA